MSPDSRENELSSTKELSSTRGQNQCLPKTEVFGYKTLIYHLQWCAIEILQQVFRNFDHQIDSDTIATLFESPNIELLESGKKLSVVSS